MIQFCTLFNKNYLLRALTMIKFGLYVLAFDDETHQYLVQLNKKNIVPIRLCDFETEELLTAKKTRTLAEYCWTCTPSIIKYCIEKYQLSACTYIDADLYFYSDPQCLIDEMGDHAVLISEHRYTQKYNQESSSGKYCVQFMTFVNNEKGNEVLNWWAKACIDWCYARHEDGKFGDQKYLDDWLVRFQGVYVMQNSGGGIAPWNVQQYKFKWNNQRLKYTLAGMSSWSDAVFYHFHALKLFPEGIACTSSYDKSEDVVNKVYRPYLREMKTLYERSPELKKLIPFSDSLAISLVNPKTAFFYTRSYLGDIKQALKLIFGVFLRERYRKKEYIYFN